MPVVYFFNLLNYKSFVMRGGGLGGPVPMLIAGLGR
jgi:hypothetical protein